jgi:hypothetical protein
MSEWIQKAQSTQLEFRNFKFFDDRSLDLVLHCRTLGVHRPGNAVLLLHGTTGSGKQFLQPEMANPLLLGCELRLVECRSLQVLEHKSAATLGFYECVDL